MTETVQVCYGVNGTTLNEEWTGDIRELQLFQSGAQGAVARVRIHTPDGPVTALYGNAYRIVRRPAADVEVRLPLTDVAWQEAMDPDSPLALALNRDEPSKFGNYI